MGRRFTADQSSRGYRGSAPRAGRWAPIAALAVGLVVASMARPAPAQSTGASPGEDSAQSRSARAQRAFDRGAELFEKGNYEQAITAFRKAHELKPSPILLQNIALAQRNLGRYSDALATARRVASRGRVNPKLDAANRALIAGLRTHRAGKRRTKEYAAPTEKRGDAPVQGARVDAGAGESATKGGQFGALGAVGIGMGAAGVGGLVTTGVLVSNLGREWDKANEPGRSPSITREEFEARQKAGRAFLFGGAALLTAGTALVVWDLLDDGTSGSRGTVSLRPALAPGTSGLTIWVEF